MNNDFFLRNRTTTAIITGGAQGLGFAIAERLAREGARGIILSGRSVDKGEKAAASLQSLGTDCIFVKADVSISRGLLQTGRRRPGALWLGQWSGQRRSLARPRHPSGYQPRTAGPDVPDQRDAGPSC